jgi:hypothetical protein
LRHKKIRIISTVILEVSHLLTVWYVPLLPAEGCFVFSTTRVADSTGYTVHMQLLFDINSTAWERNPPVSLVLIYSRLGGSPEPIWTLLRTEFLAAAGNRTPAGVVHSLITVTQL